MIIHLKPLAHCCIAVIHIQPYTYTCGSKINNNDEQTNFCRKIYLSLYSKGLRKGSARFMCERWVGDWTHCNILTPNSSVFCRLLSRSAGLLNRRVWRPIALCWVLVLSTASYLQLTRTVCRTGLYHCLTTTCFLWALHLHPIQTCPRSRLNLDVFDRMHLLRDWQLGRR